MNIYAKEGDKVICSTHNAGYDIEKEKVKKYLVIGQEYTIDCTVVDNWSTDVYLQEFPDIPFNSVFFEDAVKEPVTYWLWYWGVDQNNTSRHSPPTRFSNFEGMKTYSAQHGATHHWIGPDYWSNYEKITE